MLSLNRFVPVVLVGLLLAALQCGAALADDYQSVENSPPEDVVTGMSNKAGRGLANITTGWLELPKQIYLSSKEEGTAQAILLGPFKGIGMTVVRTLAGVGELATFFLAYPGFYDPYFEPEYVWEWK